VPVHKYRILQSKERQKQATIRQQQKAIYRLQQRVKASQPLASAPCQRDVVGLNVSQIHTLRSVSSTLPILVQAQLSNAQLRPKGRRWSDDVYHFATGLHFASAQAYRFMQNVMLLPTKKSLHAWLSKIDVNEGFSDDVFRLMETKSQSMSAQQRLCTVMFDEMSLKSHLDYSRRRDKIIGLESINNDDNCRLANHALVFMACGVCSNWRQALGVHFVLDMCDAESLKLLLHECLARLFAAGYTPVSVTCDQGANCRGVANQLDISANRPYFNHNGHKVYFLFDPPHLLKSFRNNLRGHIITFGKGNTADWSSVKVAYELDSDNHYRFMPKLTSQHVFGGSFTKMSVKMASQCISNSVSTAIRTFVSQGKMESKHLAAAELISEMNKCNDCLNSSHLYGDAPFRSALSMSTAHIAEQLDKSKALLSSMRVVRANGSNVPGVQCIKGYLITISGIQQLYADLKNLYGIRFLLTRKLCQDPLENFFAVMRRKGGCSDNPTTQQFSNLFKSACVNKLLKPTGTGNCEADSNSVLVEFCNNSLLQSSASADSLHCEAVALSPCSGQIHSPNIHQTSTKRKALADLPRCSSVNNDQKRTKTSDTLECLPSVVQPAAKLKRKQFNLEAQSVCSSATNDKSPDSDGYRRRERCLHVYMWCSASQNAWQAHVQSM
jgi:hypothetical protein